MSKAINLSHISTLWGKMKEYVTNALSGFLPKTGGTVTGDINISKTSHTSPTDGINGVTVRTPNTGTALGVGTGGANHGVWSYKLNKWMLYSDGTDLFFGNSSVGNANTPIYLNNGKPTPVTSVSVSSLGEALLTWGGKSFTGGYGPIDAAMVGELGANRLAFAKPAGVYIEYSRDGGETWSEYPASDVAKSGLFSVTSGQSFTVGYVGAAQQEDCMANPTNYLLRIYLRTSAAGVYTALNKLVMYVGTNGSQNCYVSLDVRTQNNYLNNVDTWVNRINKMNVAGWSGYNVANIASTITYGNVPASHYGEWRFTFGYTGYNPGTNSSTGKLNAYYGLAVYSIFGFGGVGWTTPSTLAKTGHLYSFDASQNASFPANLTAANLYPRATASYSIGTAQTRWGTIFGTALDINGSFVNTNFDVGTSDMVDGAEILTSYAAGGGFSTTAGKGIVYRRNVLCLYNYIKGKLDSVYQTKGDYLTNNGGQMIGKLSWKDSNALPQATNPKFFLTIDAFADGGTMKWAHVSSIIPDTSDMETRTHAAETYQPKGTYLTEHQDITGKADTSYVDTEVGKVQSALDALTGTENTTEAIDTMNEIMAFLNSYKNTDNLASVLSTLQSTIEQWVENKNYLTEHQSLAGLLTETKASQTYQPKGTYLTEHQSLVGLQPTISDLDTIRSGASKGATALQSFTESDPVFSASPASGIKTTDISNWNGKQAAISDLSTIRSGASAGATAVQPSAISDMETKTHAGNTYQPKFSVSASDNGKVLTVVNGQLAWVKVASIYTGSAAPTSTLGEDGDIYIQA